MVLGVLFVDSVRKALSDLLTELGVDREADGRHSPDCHADGEEAFDCSFEEESLVESVLFVSFCEVLSAARTYETRELEVEDFGVRHVVVDEDFFDAFDGASLVCFGDGFDDGIRDFVREVFGEEMVQR